jgi:hypothetical protein
MSLSREAFLKPVKVPTEVVNLPELGGTVTVRGMTARGRSEFEKQFQTASGKPSKMRQAEIRERLVVACCIDGDGNPLFTDADVEQIGKQSASIVERIVDVAQRLCGMSSADIEDIAKNSEPTVND